MRLSEVSSQFPILHRKIHGHRLVYLDNAATTQKPQVVLDAIVEYYSHHNANVHRGVHTLSDESTQAWLDAHAAVAAFFGAESKQLIVTRNTTEAVNLLAWGWSEFLAPGDVIVTTLQDHHSSLVPWQHVAQKQGAEIVSLPLNSLGEIDVSASLELLQQHASKLKVLSLPHVSNVLGSITPVQKFVEWLRSNKIRESVLVMVDAAQSAPHLPEVSLQTLGADALVFSGHKLYGPMGVGGLVVSSSILEQLKPVLTGGGMIDQVAPTTATFAQDPLDRFTAGTPDVASLVGLAAALQWLQQWSGEERFAHEHDVLRYAWEQLSAVPGVQLVGPPVTESLTSRVGVISWTYQGVHAHDVAQVLDRSGVAIRSGHHCTMPLHSAMLWQATCRASVAVYNTRADIDALVSGLAEVEAVFKRN